jgi:hypothetical protein
MERFIQLNLRGDSEKAGEANVSAQERKEPEPPVISSKRVSRMVNRAAHKASGEYRRGASGGIFSK